MKSQQPPYRCGDDCKGECSGEVDGIPKCSVMTPIFTLSELQTLMMLLNGYGDLMGEDTGPLAKKVEEAIAEIKDNP